MPQYIMLVNFTNQGLRGVKEVPDRQDKSRETAKKFGVERKTVWMTFGPYDFVHLYEAPNDEAMAKFVMTLASFVSSRSRLNTGYPNAKIGLPATLSRARREVYFFAFQPPLRAVNLPAQFPAHFGL
jgi:uncharacterized protein with GYD domain